MFEAKLRVECVGKSCGNPFYGDTTSKRVVEDILIHDCDNREVIAPSGLFAVIKIGDRELTITINKYYFDNETDDSFVAYFSIEERVYEVWVKFDGDKIDDLVLSEWLERGYFESGDDADKLYCLDNTDFEVVDRFF